MIIPILFVELRSKQLENLQHNEKNKEQAADELIRHQVHPVSKRQRCKTVIGLNVYMSRVIFSLSLW